MAKNDLLLVDKLLSDYASASGIADPGKVFETFAVSMFLKDFDLTSDEVEMCIVGKRSPPYRSFSMTSAQ